MCGGCFRVGVGMPEDLQRIELAHDPYRRARVAGVQHALEAGNGDAVLKGYSILLELIGYVFGGLVLSEARLRVVEYGTSDLDQLVASSIDL